LDITASPPQTQEAEAAGRPGILPTFFSKPSLSRCIPITLVVGTIISLVNQAAILFSGHATMSTWLRLASNYTTPFIVSSAGYFASQRAMWHARHTGP